MESFALADVLMTAGAAHAVPVEITNAQGAGGPALTPLLSVLHDGCSDPFDAGGLADDGLEQIPGEGDVGPERATLGDEATGVAAQTAGFAGAPVIEPGETATVTIDADPSGDRYLTFLAMVIPSDDIFIGNDDQFAWEIFDAGDGFALPGPITILGGGARDAGTEVNDNLGAAFSIDGGTATDTGAPVALTGDLSFLLGINAPTGPIGSVPGAGDVLATIEVALGEVVPIPLPASLPLAAMGLGGLALLRRRARR